MNDSPQQFKEHSTDYKQGFDDGVTLIFGAQINADERAAQAWREDIDARQQAVALIDDLGRLLMQHARQIADAKEVSDPLEVDDMAVNLLWLSLEYLTQAEIDKDFREKFPQPHQLTPLYTRWHYDLDES